jgi:urease accessory protein UreE
MALGRGRVRPFDISRSNLQPDGTTRAINLQAHLVVRPTDVIAWRDHDLLVIECEQCDEDRIRRKQEEWLHSAV